MKFALIYSWIIKAITWPLKVRFEVNTKEEIIDGFLDRLFIDSLALLSTIQRTSNRFVSLE